MSADNLDHAQELSHFMLDADIANIRQRSQIQMQGSGTCKVCANEVEAVECCGKLIVPRWCSVECRDRADL
jgi:hypothetical protein